MQLQISPITLIIVLVYVSGLAFSIGRIYEQLRQAKQKAAEQSVHLTRFPQCRTCEYNPCDLANNSDYCPARK